MSNAELIERLGDYINNTDDCALRKEASDALAAADKRIAELEKYGRVQDPLADRIAELERKLEIAREVLLVTKLLAESYLRESSDDPGESFTAWKNKIDEALAQLGDGK